MTRLSAKRSSSCRRPPTGCGKRLKPLLPILVTALERHGHLSLDDTVRERLLAASAATIDRILASTRIAAKGKPVQARKTAKGVRKSIPAHTFADWNDPDPGFTEIDLVAHCGGDVSGSFVHTLVVTDIASGWTECVPLLVRDSSLVVEALARLRTSMPFRLRGIDSDNGSEFVNETLFAYCKAQGIEFTRARAYRKNDQAWVEQKNGAVVRRLVGTGDLKASPQQRPSRGCTQHRDSSLTSSNPRSSSPTKRALGRE